MLSTLPKTLTLGTRTSDLALWQTEHITTLLVQAWPEIVCHQHPFTTQGDKTLDQPLPEIGGKGLFTQELESALRLGTIDLAVHSLKDLPVEDAPGVVVGAIVGRADVRDVLVCRAGLTWENLPQGAVVGTSSLRRQAQLLALRPDLEVRSIRGNVGTRLRKVHDGEYDATLLAGAGLDRLALSEHISYRFNTTEMLPAPGQGALAVQCRSDDEGILALLAPIDNPLVRSCVSAERTFLNTLQGGCATPVGAYAEITPEGIYLRGIVASPDGRRQIRVEGVGNDPYRLGQMVAADALFQGAAELLSRE